MIDFHAHFLPGIDDGAKKPTESVEMLRELSRQNVKMVVASPHFYVDEGSIDDFCRRRERSIKKMLTELEKSGGEIPSVAVGAEVFFFPTIASLGGLEKLCIKGTNYMLLELPFEKWSPRVMDGVYRLITNSGIIPVIAHINRYISYGNNISLAYQLKDMGAVIQINAEFFNSLKTRRKAVSYFKNSAADVLGSDCHNMAVRAPEIGKAAEYFQKKLGEERFLKMNKLSEKILSGAELIYKN